MQWTTRHNICNVKFHMSDGSSSPDLENEYRLEKEFNFGDNKVGKIEIQEILNEHSIGRVHFFDREGKKLLEIKGNPLLKDHVQTTIIRESEKLCGFVLYHTNVIKGFQCLIAAAPKG